MRPRPDRGEDAWELVVNVGNDPVSGKRKQRSRLFRGTKRNAETALAQLVAEVTDRRHGPGTDAPLSVLVERWLEMVADDLSPTTLQGYRGILRRYIDPAIGKRPVSKITTPDLDAYYRALLAKPLAPATVRQVHAVLRRAFRQAVRWGWLSLNPAIDATPPQVRRSNHTPPSVEQVTALLAAAEKASPSMAALFRTSASTGARRGEVCGLRWSRVDLEGGSVLIESAVVEVDGSIFEKDTKTHQSRRVALGPGTIAALRAQRSRCNELALAAGVGRAVDPFVWSADLAGERPIAPGVVTKRFQRLAAVHAPGAHLHDLRHFAASQLLAAGVPVKTVSGRLGHGSAAMTLDVYGHHVGAADQGAADVLEALIDG